jgi:hypothetical protein
LSDHDPSGDRPDGTDDRAAAAWRGARELAEPRAQLTTELTALLAQRAPLHANAESQRAALRTAASRFALALRRAGAPPERMLVEVKAAAPEALWASGDGARDVMESVVRWSIEAYYSPLGS